MDTLRRAREASQQIVQNGAVMAVNGSPATYQLVGALRWCDDHRVAWFVAHGDSEKDAHVLEFDRVQAIETLGICFLKDDRLLGYLSPIGTAQVEDPDDYRIGWQIWKEVAPLYDGMIERAFDEIDGSSVDPWPRAPRRDRRAVTVAA